jgi:hypothetical protein
MRHIAIKPRGCAHTAACKSRPAVLGSIFLLDVHAALRRTLMDENSPAVQWFIGSAVLFSC